MIEKDRLERVIRKIDLLNAEDPVGREIPFADRVEAWVRRLDPAPSEALLIAVRGQHVRRWIVARTSYPDGRGGYLRWREDLKRMHAATVAGLMAEEGLAETDIEAVRQIVLKRRLGENPDAQTMEDALCLVFLETQFEDLRQKTEEAKMVDIVRKTWRKMSEKGHESALRLPLTAAQLELVRRALTDPQKQAEI